MKTISEREQKLRANYVDMVRSPMMLPESGVIDTTSFHLYHMARYISRLKGFSAHLGKPIRDFVDTDLGACILGSAPVIEAHLKETEDRLLSCLWQDFSGSLERFRSAETGLSIEDIEIPFRKICDHLHFNPDPI